MPSTKFATCLLWQDFFGFWNLAIIVIYRVFKTKSSLKRCLDDFYSLSGLPELLIWHSNWAGLNKQTLINWIYFCNAQSINVKARRTRATQQHDGGYAGGGDILDYVVAARLCGGPMAEAALLMKESWFCYFVLEIDNHHGQVHDGIHWVERTPTAYNSAVHLVKCHYIIMSRLDKHSEDLLLWCYLLLNFWSYFISFVLNLKHVSEERRQRTRFRRSWTFNDTDDVEEGNDNDTMTWQGRRGKNFAVVVEVAAIVGFILRFQDNDTWMTHDTWQEVEKTLPSSLKLLPLSAFYFWGFKITTHDTWHMTHDKKWKNFAVVVEVAAIVGFILRFQDNNINLTYTNKNDNIKYRILLLLGLVGFELNIN